MRVFIFVDNPSLEDQEPGFLAELQSLVEAQAPHLEFVDTMLDAHRQLGVLLEPKAAKHLIEPLNALYVLAKQYQCEFVIGAVHGEDYEEVCYFGDEEGRPDAFEVASYLGEL